MTKLNHRVPFPLTGKGHFLFFSMNDLAEIEDRFGGASYFELIDLNVGLASPKTIMAVIDCGLKDKDATPVKIDWGKPLEWTLESAAEPIMNALSLAISGKDYSGLLAEARERQEKLARANAEAIAKTAAEEKEADPFPTSEDLKGTKPTGNTRA